MNGINVQRQYCLQAWINCEHLAAILAHREDAILQHLATRIDECARICMETWQTLQGRVANGQKLVLLCMGACEDCADLCSQFDDPEIQQCGRTCRNCADSFAQLALASAYN